MQVPVDCHLGRSSRGIGMDEDNGQDVCSDDATGVHRAKQVEPVGRHHRQACKNVHHVPSIQKHA